MEDQPFIVDSMRLFLRRQEAGYQAGFNLLFDATRDENGLLIAVGAKGGIRESMVVLKADFSNKSKSIDELKQVLELNLQLAHATVKDHKAMNRCLGRFSERCEVLADQRPDQAPVLRETSAFLLWLLRENFVFMGIGGSNSPLGIESVDSIYRGIPDGEWVCGHAQGHVQVRKGEMESPIHRAGRIDEIRIEVDGEKLFIRGMFTYRAVTQPSRNVPILRKVLSSILNDEQESPFSHRYKGIANVFDSLPTEFLFIATPESIREIVDLVFEAEQKQDVGITFMMTGSHSAFCLVTMPKDRFSDTLRRDLEGEISSTLASTYTDHGILVGRYDSVLLHYFLTGVKNKGEEVAEQLIERIKTLTTPWAAKVWDEMARAHGEDAANRMADTYNKAFPEEYMRATSAPRARRDIELLQRLSATKGGVLADLFEEGDDLILRVYQSEDVYLTELLPVLVRFGLTVIDSYSTSVNSRGGGLNMDTFRLQAEGTGRTKMLERAELLVKAIEAVFASQVDNDPLNALILKSGLNWKEADIIRGYARYARQLNLSLSVARAHEILLQNPETCRALVALFHARFNPDLTSPREAAISCADEALNTELRRILSHDEDLVFQAIYLLVSNTLRTNYYRDDRPFWYLSFKIKCADLESLMGRTRPLYEIFVHHKDIEGVHLRFGMVARGGLRWSNRDDYRTEVLGLATTQQVKNVVIVPTGSKGGFFLRNLSADRAKARAEADYHYKTFIKGLLDVTDNNLNGEQVRPPRVVCHDGFDAYLVVAADKGTAHLSDTANAISEAYGFWLGDAFASGGSNGYDHKEVGITARGAWVLVKRHFAEMGIDPYNEPFTCAGVGDLSGDVFGNGLVESPHTKLFAAFNHLHIFLDPNPDMAVSFAERKRLFESGPGGGWENYNLDCISEGGGIFDRRVKSITLSQQAQDMLGIDGPEVAPEIVIHRILLMEVDLLWNGGIGTYVKASHENDADADDRSNDGVRVNANQLRAKIIGEGGNLGFTHQARIEAGLCGVRLNTDAIDNSAGVDMSDHEVNIKILLGAVEASGGLDRNARNAFLESMTDEVADLVLADNDAHGRQLSRDQIRSTENIFPFGRAIALIERAFDKDRADLNLPSDEVLQDRASQQLGLTRPELAVLSAWVKMYVKRELVAADLRSLPEYTELLMSYFPKVIQEEYPEQVQTHMLADEIVATVITTQMIADGGAAFFPMIREITNASVLEITHAMLKAQVLVEAKKLRTSLESLRATASLRALNSAWVKVDAGAREVILFWLSSRGRIPTEEEKEQMIKAKTTVYQLQAAEVAAENQKSLNELLAIGLSEEVATLVLRAQYLNVTLTIWAEAHRTNEEFACVAVKYLAVARATRLDVVLDDLQKRPSSGRWDPIALRILYTRFQRLLGMAASNTPAGPPECTVDTLEPQLAAGHLRGVREEIDRFLTGDERPSVATLLVLEERLERTIAQLAL